MTTCSKCGSPMSEEDVICISCGARAEKNTSTPAPVQPSYQQPPQQPSQQPYQQPYQPSYEQPQEKPGLATAAIICAILFPLIGLILGLVGKKKYADPTLAKRCNIAVIIAIVMMVINFIAYL